MAPGGGGGVSCPAVGTGPVGGGAGGRPSALGVADVGDVTHLVYLGSALEAQAVRDGEQLLPEGLAEDEQDDAQQRLVGRGQDLGDLLRQLDLGNEVEREPGHGEVDVHHVDDGGRHGQQEEGGGDDQRRDGEVVGTGDGLRPPLAVPLEAERDGEHDVDEEQQGQRQVGVDGGRPQRPDLDVQVVLRVGDEAALRLQLEGPHGVDGDDDQADEHHQRDGLGGEHRAVGNGFVRVAQVDEAVDGQHHHEPDAAVDDDVGEEGPEAAAPVGDGADVGFLQHEAEPGDAQDEVEHEDVGQSVGRHVEADGVLPHVFSPQDDEGEEVGEVAEDDQGGRDVAEQLVPHPDVRVGQQLLVQVELQQGVAAVAGCRVAADVDGLAAEVGVIARPAELGVHSPLSRVAPSPHPWASPRRRVGA